MNTAIVGTGSYLPAHVLTSVELGERLGVGERWITDKTLIRERRVAAPDEATSDLATRAAQAALSAAGAQPLELDLIVLATSTPDRPIPAAACTVQANLGASHAVAFDVDAVCTGFIYALSVARAMLLEDRQADTAVVIGADTYSRILDYTDRSTAALFGDGAGALVLRKCGHDGLFSTVLGTDGTLADLVQMPAGGSRTPPSADTVECGQHYFAMRGREVRALTAKVVPQLMADLLERARLDLAQVDALVPHQANGIMLRDWASELGLRPGIMHTTVEHYGNTGAASVPITLDHAVRGGSIHGGDTVVMVALGGGVTWGGTAVTWVSPRDVRDY
ncbi:3-oxoacyl-ACP synthase III family protein [Amycolatopsis alkalitolerans]|uniref:Beta-ketoacyl-ACP synthase III n=1 Tax=Amycolatopsis alkalitolerans TaxID=2547244 RepID=A0A5C4LPR3_9PSEU|nr:beta-ketoacyl-ACP synthase 3 [Amycolatopsis alkalitolerans]TNC19271.1 beta-ketoacyl-ACP synthase III [Amycolatopsis alkalitolerans]